MARQNAGQSRPCVLGVIPDESGQAVLASLFFGSFLFDEKEMNRTFL